MQKQVEKINALYIKDESRGREKEFGS